MSAGDRIEPCPWCGAAAIVREGQGVGFKKEERYVACPGDHWFCGRGPMMKNEAKAIAAWNRVATSARDMQERCARLVEREKDGGAWDVALGSLAAAIRALAKPS